MPKTDEDLFNDRVSRALKQRMYLINYKKEDDLYTFSLEGSVGKPYVIVISDTVKCSCIDFTRRKKVCKHIIFIVCKVYKIEIKSDDPNINLLQFFETVDLDQSVKKQLISGNCLICFDDTDNGSKCNTCIGVFHPECINIWLRINKNCPMCRSYW